MLTRNGIWDSSYLLKKVAEVRIEAQHGVSLSTSNLGFNQIQDATNQQSRPLVGVRNLRAIMAQEPTNASEKMCIFHRFFQTNKYVNDPLRPKRKEQQNKFPTTSANPIFHIFTSPGK